MRIISGFLLVSFLAQCQQPQDVAESPRVLQPVALEVPNSLSDYWYKGGGAEISSYRLEQARYGEIHEGTAVAVFVTEPFSASKQVKLDDYRSAGDDKVSVLKLNLTKKFLTGIYPYSMMLSTFTPMSADPILKISTTSQEWCGHTFMQLNPSDSQVYRLRGYSYFESEGDVDTQVPVSVTEDELWSRLRMGPDNLPTGDFTILPGTFYLRLRHRPLETVPVSGSLNDLDSSEFWEVPHRAYTLNYSDEHALTIYFERAKPYRIVGWEEKQMSGFGKAEVLTTKAKLINTIRSRYWGQNSNEDRVLRDQLGLSTK